MSQKEPIVSMRVEGLDELLRKLRRLGKETAQPAIAEGANHIKEVIAVYPPRSSRPQPPKTFKQRVFLIWAIANRIIDFPYRRGISPGSQALGRRWTVEFRDDGLTGVVGNNARYAEVVHDWQKQSHYHQQTGWKTDRDVVEQEARAVFDILNNHYRAALNRDESKK